ncbi:MAG: hemolysin III family protein [Bacteroidia bacterium]|nr:hemolysin III family protein [Bacteroidia bacterium]
MSTKVASLSLKEEFANSLSHGFGLLFGIISLPIPIALAAQSGNIPALVGVSIFGFSFLMVFAFSTLYHAVSHPRIKKALQVMDHISIYFLIAGSYTPFLLVYMFNATGITVLSVLWAAVLVGIVFKVFATGKWNLVSTAMYLLMGWSVLFVPQEFFGSLSFACLTLVALGGVSYTLGVVFYLWEKLPYNHAIWHIFVLGGAICHYVAVLLAVS